MNEPDINYHKSLIKIALLTSLSKTKATRRKIIIEMKKILIIDFRQNKLASDQNWQKSNDELVVTYNLQLYLVLL